MPATSTQRLAQFSRPRLTVRGFLRRLADFDARYRNRVDMEALDDRILRDVGLTRADVAAELRRPFPR